MNDQLKIFSGNANLPLAESICRHAGVELGKCEIVKFSNENIKVKIGESVRGQDVFVIQPSCPPVKRGDHGAAHHDRRNPARERRQDHRRTSILPLCPLGQEGRAADFHHRAAHGRPAADRRRQPHRHHEPPFPADPGFFPDPGGPPARRQAPVRLLPATRHGKLRGRGARRRERQTGRPLRHPARTAAGDS